MIPYGMAKTVRDSLGADPVPVSVTSTGLPGSASCCPKPQLMTLKSVFAHLKRLMMRIFH